MSLKMFIRSTHVDCAQKIDSDTSFGFTRVTAWINSMEHTINFYCNELNKYGNGFLYDCNAVFVTHLPMGQLNSSTETKRGRIM